uniref:T7SS effector LXG polymorphic toxin n=1 Tax=uncultured Allobacillus sp. TaxID=1638025 RepID=UPI002592D4E3|nr:T7SS effector LXG polymorphic toxin [uncultured Allobacillus sp.]
MGKKVNLPEVIELSEDLKSTASELSSKLNQLEKEIDQLSSLDSFSGMAATEAKKYFNDFHKTLIKSFDLLFNDLNETLQKHLHSFGVRVDKSEAAIVQSDYLNEIRADVESEYERLENEQDRVREVISSVSDISTANHPIVFSMSRDYRETVETVTELEDNFNSFTQTGNQEVNQIEETIHQIEKALSYAGAVSGSARFTNYRGNGTSTGLPALKKYNEERRQAIVEEARDVKSDAIAAMNEDSQEILNQAFTDLKNGEIDQDTYYAVVDELRNLQNNDMDEDAEVSENLIQYVANHINVMTGSLRDNTIATYIKESIKDRGNSVITRAGLVEQMNGNQPSSTSSYLRDKGNKILNVGRAVSGGLSALTIGYGTYMDYTNTDKTVGEAFTKNAAATGAGTLSGVAVAGAIKAGAFVLGTATPVGWTIVAGVAVGTVATMGFNWAYDANFLGLQDGLDWAGQKLDQAGDFVADTWTSAQEKVDEGLEFIGESLKSGLDSLNPFT